MADNQQELRKFVAPEILYGPGSVHRAAPYIVNMGGRHVLLVSDRGIEAAGWTSLLEDDLSTAGIRFTPFYEIEPNPRDREVAAGVEVYLDNNCDMIVALGGGSPIDCAKAIGVVVSNRKSIEEFEGVDRIREPMPPLICIPTTSGTSADVSQFAIILNTGKKYKMAIVSKGLVPDLSLIDPGLTMTMDPVLTAETGLDALTHAVEAYVSNASSPLTDLHAERAVEYILGNLRAAVEHPDNLSVRSLMTLGSLHAGLAFSNANLGLVHAMAHALGGLLELPHGLCNALLLEHVVEYNFDAEPDRYRRLAEIMSGRQLSGLPESAVSDFLCGMITELRNAVGIDDSFKLPGISRHVLSDLAGIALNDACIVTNPKVPTEKDIISIYEQILTG